MSGADEHVADSAKAHVKCWCGEVVELAIPVLTTFDGERLRAYVDQEAGYGQELWDHVLIQHGPTLEDQEATE